MDARMITPDATPDTGAVLALLQLPLGAVWSDQWRPASSAGGQHERVIGADRGIEGHPAQVRATAMQFADGTISAPRITVGGAGEKQPLTPAQARQLATALVQAAGDADTWTRHGDASAAVAALAEAATRLRNARENAKDAGSSLAGARRARAEELCELIADAVAFTERLSFTTATDAASDAHQQRILREGSDK